MAGEDQKRDDAVCDRRAELTEHLAELRTRLIRIAIYIVVAASLAWVFYDFLFWLITKPMVGILIKDKSSFLLTGFAEGFMIRVQICVVAGIILASPLVTMEIWGFVAPGLTRTERRTLMWIGPLSIVLFLSGVVLCYVILPNAFSWFVLYVPKHTELKPDVLKSILFTVKMLFMFGVVFELPIVLMLLGKVGIVSSRFLWQNWRVAMVGVAIVAAVATPSNDALTMMFMAIPVAILYFLSIGLVRLVEKRY